MTPTQNKILSWEFPLPRTHTGILLGNGVQGLMVWGVETLNITVGRAGFWDHRGGKPFTTATNYKELKRLLENRDEAGIQNYSDAITRGSASRTGRFNSAARGWRSLSRMA